MVCNEERKKAFLVYASTYEAAVKHLSLEQMGELFLKLGKYSLEGDTEVESENPLIDILISNAKPLMESAEERHQRAIENGKKGGEKGKEKGGGIGRPRKGESKKEYEARKAEWRDSHEEKPPKNPLDIDKDKDRDIEKDIDINKNTNNKDNNSSAFANSLSSFESSNLIADETKQGTEPSQEDRRQEVDMSFNSAQDSTAAQADEIDPRFGNPVNLDGVEEIEPPIWIDIDPDDLPPLINEGWTPPPAELQHNEVVFDDAALAPPKPQKSGNDDLEELIETSLEAAAESKGQGGKMADYMPYLRQAKDAYKALHNCDEQRAREDVSWKLHCLMENRKKKMEVAAILSKIDDPKAV